MISNEKLESYLLDLSLTYEKQSDDIWIINGEDKGLENVVIMLEDPIVIIRVKVMNIPAGNKVDFYEELLKLNASDLVHGAYAIEGNSVLLVDTLEGETMDLEELQASFDAMGLALAQHYKKLTKFRNKG
jgi:hypothetical protein